MNVFADRLFAVLLGWTGSLFNGIWNLVTNNTAGISGFLQRFWLPLIFILLAFGTVCDYVIWLIRWRPYFVWRTWFRKQDSRRRLNVTRSYMEDLDLSPLDLPEYREGQFVADQSQAVDEPVFLNFAPIPQKAGEENLRDDPVFWTGVSPLEYQAYQPAEGEYDADAVQPQIGDYYPEPAAYQGDPIETLAYPDNSLPEENADQVYSYSPEFRTPETEQIPGASSRRRRVGSRRRRPNILRNIRDTLFSREDSDAAFDSLPPPVGQGEAYHKPFYPQNYAYRPNPNQPEQNEDKTQR